MNWRAVSFLLVEIEPLSIRTISFTIAALLLAITSLLLKQPLRLKKIKWPQLRSLQFFFGAFNVLTAFGQTFIKASKAAIIAYTMPPLTVILATMCLCEQLEKLMILALLIAMFGLRFLIAEDLDLLIKNPTVSIIMLFQLYAGPLGI